MTKKTINSAAQKRTKATAKNARLKEAGLKGPRVGRVTTSGQRTQARRDAK